jgi:hypothetical protein
VVALLIALALAGPPKASLTAGTSHVPLALSSWCWGTKCGAPIGKSTKTAVVSRGALVTVELGFVPKAVQVAVAGKRLAVVRSGHLVSWRAARGGGLTVNATGGRGWATYVGRIRLR